MDNNKCQQGECNEAIGLLMTYRCNLNCKYCYIHNKYDKDMTFEMARSILEPFLLKENGLLDITLMGGETLLAQNVIRPLIEWAEKGEWKREFRFFGSTNGTLLNNDLKQWLKVHKNSLTLGLSYDGLPSAQKDNRGFSEIDVDFFIKTWPYQPIQMTINADSVEKMAAGVIYLLEKGAVVHPNVAYESDDWPEEKIAEYGKQLNRLIYYYNSHNNLPLITQFVHDLNEYADSIDSHKTQPEVCGAGNGFQVFDTNGTSYPCHILSPLVLSGDKLLGISEGIISETTDFEDPRCINCPYTSSCSTCIACNYIYRDCLKSRDRTHCKIMKTDVRAFIKKEVLRLTHKQMITPEDATEIDSIKKLIEYEKEIAQQYN